MAGRWHGIVFEKRQAEQAISERFGGGDADLGRECAATLAQFTTQRGSIGWIHARAIKGKKVSAVAMRAKRP